MIGVGKPSSRGKLGDADLTKQTVLPRSERSGSFPLSLEIVQVIKPTGDYVKKNEPDISDSELKRIYRTMILTRQLDVRALQLQRQGRIFFYIGCLGQEAAHIGAAYALGDEDWIFPAYREMGAALLRGLPLQKLLDQFYANRNDLLKGRQLANLFGSKEIRFVSGSAPIATQIPHAVGVGIAAKIRGDPIVTLVYFGDGATSENDFHPGMNFAGVFKAPTVLFCQNNGWAISVPLERQTASETIAIKAKAYGFPGVRVDGNDVLAVYATTKEAVDRARAGEGPTLIEALTYRLGPHSSADDPKRYRDEKEVEEWKNRDGIVRFRKYLEKKGIWNEAQEEKLLSEVDAEISSVIEHAEKVGPPPIETLIEDVYAEIPWHIREQYDELLQYRGVTGAETGS
jgi:pyruvate dehydrogenase E1 component alpha subunit